MAKRKQKPESAAGTPLPGFEFEEDSQTAWIKPEQLSGQRDLFDVPKVHEERISDPKKSDWLDDHLEIIGLPDGAAEQIKDRLRREF